MTAREQQLVYLERLAEALKRQGFATELASAISKPHLKVANAEQPSLNERVICQQDTEGSWSFWWPWSQPIGSVDELGLVVDKIGLVLRSVQES